MPFELGFYRSFLIWAQNFFPPSAERADPTLYEVLQDADAQAALIVDHIGTPTGDATTTVLGRLAAIENLLKCVCGDFPPDLTDPSGCESPLESLPGALAVIPGDSGRVYATWPLTLPDGFSNDADSTYGDPHAGIKFDDPDGTYTVYVQSQRSHTFQGAHGALIEQPCNTWLSFAPDTTYEFNVPAGSDIHVYVCYTPAAGFTDCVNIGSLVGSYEQLDSSAVFNSSYAVWTSIPGISTTNSEVYSGHTFQWDNSVAVAVVDAIGWTFTKESGPDIRFLVKEPDGTVHVLTIASSPLTLTMHTATLWCDLGSGGDTSSFSFEVCPGA